MVVNNTDSNRNDNRGGNVAILFANFLWFRVWKKSDKLSWLEAKKKKIKIQSVRSKTNVNLSNAKSKEREGERERRVPWRFDERNEHLLRVRGSRANSEYNKQRRRVPLQPPFPPLFPLPLPRGVTGLRVAKLDDSSLKFVGWRTIQRELYASVAWKYRGPYGTMGAG